MQKIQTYRELSLGWTGFIAFYDSLRTLSDGISVRGGLVRSLEIGGKDNDYMPDIIDLSMLATYFPRVSSFNSKQFFNSDAIIHLVGCKCLVKVSLFLQEGSTLQQLLEIRGVKEINLEIENDYPDIPTVAAAVPYQLSGRHELDYLRVNIQCLDSHLFAFLQHIQATTLNLVMIGDGINDCLTYDYYTSAPRHLGSIRSRLVQLRHLILH
jgi:hypothetical protein